MQAITLFSTAKGYVQSAYLMMSNPERYQTPDDSTFYLSFHMLCGFATELFLKSYLSHKGADDNTLRKLGHDLDKLLNSAKNKGLNSSDAIALVEYLNEHHKGLGFRYMKTAATYRTPDLVALFNAFSSLKNAIDAAVGASASHGRSVGGRWDFPRDRAHWRIDRSR